MSVSKICENSYCDDNTMPDVAKQSHILPQGTLNWVGMSEIEMPVFIMTPDQRQVQTVAHVQAYVNLADPNSKGIHMSRLYLMLDEMLGMNELTPGLLRDIVTRFVASQKGVSTSAYLECRFNYFERRRSLKSDNSGWKSYPVRVLATMREGHFDMEVGVDVAYSSTCPQSAALARQLIQEGFRDTFGENQQLDSEEIFQWLGTTEGISATPHSQRSIAQVKIKLTEKARHLPLTNLIDQIENTLQTPVQATVKREDEQEFARLNASNLMFCEDAARRLKGVLSEDIAVRDFWIRVNHMESLHAHDAVAIAVKGVDGGYRDDAGEYISC
ncbi:MAG: GTP cyclohydrolase I (EC type 2 [uncultured Thiotrichaceae bacterium]|uniref:GTP cyclohydrolase FolE2 n=1 Tax=uncultured Thiotrichaceae bacterium TaxID=298394 RepID=A0A6S6SZT7_9GAMM|nr:MAG: GTP cyclohydrolase I (EC type 2 [uncultured Thiotrichaceae bacterium]